MFRLSRVHVDDPHTAPGTRQAAGGGLVAPGGIVVSNNGSIYVTNFSVQPGGVGTVVKITP